MDASIADPAAAIQVSAVSHWFPGGGAQSGLMQALASTSLTVGKQEFVALVGPSGCGKTTLLNMIAGLIVPTEGAISLSGSPARLGNPRLAYMLAKDALLPWRTVVQNVAIPLELKGIPKRESRERALQAVDEVGLRDVAAYYPAQLSHGMRQRAALARTFVSNPTMLLMDEPFSALDAQTRLRIHALFLRLWEEHKSTVVLVTHDLAEALTLADRVVVFSARPGRVLLDAQSLLERPRDPIALQADDRFHAMYKDVWSVLAGAVR